MNKIRIATLILLLFFGFRTILLQSYSAPKYDGFWQFQSIDTMKYSRDKSREKLNDPFFDSVIDGQVKNIAQTGATHVAIATPYDEEFLPILKRWVKAAREYHLKVWFRGNFAGWEKWFDYPPITRNQHFKYTQAFVLNNRDLFEDGDIFTPCPECENGGPGDPRTSGDILGHRKFLLDEYKVTKDAFKKIGKKVASNYDSMNADVARVIMDRQTTKGLDGLVVIDHYVKSPEQLAADVSQIAQNSDGKIVLGEFGAPIEDLSGEMTEEEQASWIKKALTKLLLAPNVTGLNYWVSVGGSTAIWDEEGRPRKAREEIKKFFKPTQISGVVKDELGNPIAKVKIQGLERETLTDRNGYFQLPYLNLQQTFKVNVPGYTNFEIKADPQRSVVTIVLRKEKEDMVFKIKRFLKSLRLPLY